MCGVTGFLQRSAVLPGDALSSIARAMASTLRHRGPDDSGEWVDPSAGIALGFRRLSIIDLSPAGHQPMVSASGRYVIAYNGEVYNFERIRKELIEADRAPTFRGHSDTEVMLAAIDAWGLRSAVSRFIGMFAFALWDRKERKLHLVRDRVGVKPLYYGRCGNTFFFGSELKAFHAHPSFDSAIDRDSLALFMRYGYIPAPHTIYRGFSKVSPGTIVTVSTTDFAFCEAERYWTPTDAMEKERMTAGDLSEEGVIAELESLLRDAVGLRMISDVPLGVFLSGGVDSSLVTALMQAQSARPVKTFSIGFPDFAYDEAPFAKAVAGHLGTEHTELYVTPQQAMAVIPSIPRIYDEPFADSSQIPTHLVSALAREHVTVALSGDGGDELFGGYPRYLVGQKTWAAVAAAPPWIRHRSASVIRAISPSGWNTILTLVRPLLPPRLRQALPGDKLYKFASILDAGNAASFHLDLVSHWKTPENVVLSSVEPVMLADTKPVASLNLTERMMLTDLMTYLPDDILVKVDRASMAVSLEAREPLLDHRLVEFALRLPMRYKVRKGEGKWALRQVLYRHVPRDLIERPKSGFAMPMELWLRGPLREWAEVLLSPQRIAAEGYFDPAIIARTWREFIEEGRPWYSRLWSVLMFQAWLEQRWKDAPASAATAG